MEWERVALPLLRALADDSNAAIRDGYLSLGRSEGAGSLGLELDDGEIHDALLALGDVDYVDFKMQYAGGGTASVLGIRVTGRGMQALGQWPALRASMSPMTLVAVLERLRDYAPDETTRDQLEEAATAVREKSGSAVRDAVTAFGAAALKARYGLG